MIVYETDDADFADTAIDALREAHIDCDTTGGRVLMAERLGPSRSIFLGGIVCVMGVLACVPLLPAFWRYRKSEADSA